MEFLEAIFYAGLFFVFCVQFYLIEILDSNAVEMKPSTRTILTTENWGLL